MNITIEADHGPITIEIGYDENAESETNVRCNRFLRDDSPYVVLRGFVEQDDGTGYVSIHMTQEEAKQLGIELQDASTEDPEPIIQMEE